MLHMMVPGADQQCEECEDFIEKLAKDRVNLTFFSKGMSTAYPRARDRTDSHRYHVPRPTRRTGIGYKTRSRSCRCIRILLIRFRHALHALCSFVVVLVLVVLVMQWVFRYFAGTEFLRRKRSALQLHPRPLDCSASCFFTQRPSLRA
jgi:hypothetical protein